MRALGENARHRAAALAAARKRDDAERAHVVASAHDGHEGRDAVSVVPDGRDVGVGFLAGKMHVDGGLAGFLGFRQETGEVAVSIRPDDKVHQRFLFQQLSAEALGHAAEDTDDEIGLTLDLPPSEPRQSPPHAVFRFLADGARVDEDDIGLVLRGGQSVAILLEN